MFYLFYTSRKQKVIGLSFLRITLWLLFLAVIKQGSVHATPDNPILPGIEVSSSCLEYYGVKQKGQAVGLLALFVPIEVYDKNPAMFLWHVAIHLRIDAEQDLLANAARLKDEQAVGVYNEEDNILETDRKSLCGFEYADLSEEEAYSSSENVVLKPRRLHVIKNAAVYGAGIGAGIIADIADVATNGMSTQYVPRIYYTLRGLMRL